MSETEKPKGNWVEQAVAKIPEDKLPKPEVTEETPAVETVAETPEPKTEPEPKAKEAVEDADEEGGDDEVILVKRKALKAERGKRKHWEKIAKEAEISFAKAEERLSIMQQMYDQSQQQTKALQTQTPQAQAPDRNADPLGYIEHQLNQERQARSELESQLKQQQGFTQQQQEIARLHTAYSKSAQEFAGKKSDFTQAYNFVWQQLDKEMELRGISDPNARRQALVRDEMQFAAMQFQAGRNPAEVIYQMAELRGYKAAAQKEAEQKPAATEEVELQQKRQEAMSPLSNAGGKPPSNRTLKDIVNMAPDEFREATKGKNWEKLLRQAGSAR